MTTLALGDEQGAPGRLMPNIGTTLLDRLLGQTQGLGIATLPSVSSSILVPTLIFPTRAGFLGASCLREIRHSLHRLYQMLPPTPPAWRSALEVGTTQDC